MKYRKNVMENRIKKIEEYVKALPQEIKPGHGFDHVDRVRNWALKIANTVDYKKFELVEAAALLHDIGRTIKIKNNISHGEAGAPLAEKYLTQNKLFDKDEINIIIEAVKYHSSVRDTDNIVLDIIRDADILDLLGANGIIRGIASEYKKILIDDKFPKGKTWQMSNKDFNKKYKNKWGLWPTIPDQINFQISCYCNLKTKYAKQIAGPMVEFMKKYMLVLEKEVNICYEK